ncbi:MAG: hypothetical protein IKE28_09995 [Solobacterium sp.]|nr:hypothetical protein [Solobacterium sp.]
MNENGNVIRRLVRIAVMTAVLEAAKFALNAVPNVELVTLLLIVYTKQFGWKDSLIVSLLFATIESMWWGISIWTVTYFYVWPILVFLTAGIKEEGSVWPYCLLSAVFGLLFGMLCALVTLVTSGWNAAVAWWIAGIPFDLIHGVSNFVICFLLYKPLRTALSHISERGI